MTLPTLPILDLSRQYQQLKADVDQAVLEVMASGAFILGPTVQRFEAHAAQYLGVQHAIGVASGTDALYIALRTLGIGPGDEVLCPSFTYIATSESIAHTGATPVFIDIAADGTFNMDVTALAGKITPRTKAILPVHLYGQAVDMDTVMTLANAHGLTVVEDCAQAFGAEWKGQKVGSFGDFGCFSFFPTKNLGAYGDGGLLSTNRDDLAERARMIRVHGSKQRYYHELTGVNSRLDAIQAAVLDVKLPHIDTWNQARRNVAAFYTQHLSQIPGITPPAIHPDVTHVFHQYTLQVDSAIKKRDELQTDLKAEGITTMIYYPVPCHTQGTHQNLGYALEDLPRTAQASQTVLSLPIFPELTEDEQQRVIDSIRKVVSQPVAV